MLNKLSKSNKASVSIIVYCENAENIHLIDKLLKNDGKHKSLNIKDVCVLALNASAPSTQGDFSVHMYQDSEALSEQWNRCAADAKGEILLFLRDRAFSGVEFVISNLCRHLLQSDFDALSPRVYAEREEQDIYNGQNFSQAFFYGYPILDYFARYEKSPLILDFPESCIIPVQALSEDCVAVRTEVFRSEGGFAPGFSHYPVFELSCRLQKTGRLAGWVPDLLLEAAAMYGDKADYIGEEFLYILERHGGLFSEVDCNPELYRAVFCPEKGIGSKGRGRIFLCSHELSLTGAPVVLLEMAQRLHRKGFQIFFCSSTSSGPLAEKVLEEGFPLMIDSAMMSERFLGENAISKTPVLLDGISPIFDKIVINTLKGHTLLPRFLGRDINVVLWVHEGKTILELDGDCVPSNICKNITENIKVYCGGQYSKDVINSYGLFPNAEVLLYGVEDHYTPQIKPERNNGDPLKFLLAGAYQERKGQELLIDAILLLPIRYLKRTKFYFMGNRLDEVLSEKIHSFCKAWPNAWQIPVMPRQKLFNLYRYIDVIISPSRDDPMPIVQTEAMMFHKICICSTATGTAAYVQNGISGYTFEDGDAEGLAHCIMEAVDHAPELQTMGEKSRKLYDEYFSIPVFDVKLEEIFGH